MAPGQVGWKEMLRLYDADNINAETKLYGVIADPVGHSYSPLIHNVGFKHQQLNNRYLPFRVPPEDLDFFMDNCQRMGIKGLSVTIPHKEEVMDYLTEPSIPLSLMVINVVASTPITALRWIA